MVEGVQQGPVLVGTFFMVAERTWARPLPRATPCIFLQPEIYKMGVSIAKHIPCI